MFCRLFVLNIQYLESEGNQPCFTTLLYTIYIPSTQGAAAGLKLINIVKQMNQTLPNGQPRLLFYFTDIGHKIKSNFQPCVKSENREGRKVRVRKIFLNHTVQIYVFVQF